MTPERKRLALALCSLAEQALDLQRRVISWQITNDEDHGALMADVRRLGGYMEDVREEAERVR